MLDFTQVGAGPLAAMLLADLGAEVTKVEPLGGDLGRKLGPPWYSGQSPVFITFNRGKRSICVDLKSAEGRRLALQLARKADVIIESFRPGVMERFGLGYDAVKELNPTVVYCSVSGYGQTGPYAQHAGVDGIMQAGSGLMGLIGVEQSEPCKVQAPVVDIFTGYVAGYAVLAQLLARAQTGKGGYLDVSLFGSAIALQQSAITAYLGERQQPTKIGSAAPYSAPNEAFETADGWIMVAAYISDQWPRLCRVLMREEMIEDGRFRTSSDRVTHRAEMRKLLEEPFKQKVSNDWLEILQREDILCSRVATYSDVMEHPQLRHLGMIVTTKHPQLGSFQSPGLPVNSRDLNAVEYAPAPDLGEHSRQILREMEYSDEQIDELLIRRIVWQAPEAQRPS